MFEDEDWLLAFPFGFEGGTQGENEREVAEMAADWLKVEVEHRLIRGLDMSEVIFGNEPQPRERVLILAIGVSFDTVHAVPAHKAADMLGVSRGRVTQMVSAGLLDGFRKGRDAFVTRDSVNARLKDAPKAGRPRKLTAVS